MRVTRKAGKIEALRQTVKALNGEQSRVGWFPSAVYEGGQPVAGVAAVQEFGTTISENDATVVIPPRPFFRTTISEKQNEWKKTAEDIARASAQGKIAPGGVAEGVGLAAAGHVRETITKIVAPSLKKATVDARKRRLANGGKGAKASITKPLVDTGVLLNSLTSETTKK